MSKPDLSFLCRHPAHFLALGFGSGLSPKAPGTAGTLIALPLYYLIFVPAASPEFLHYFVITILFIIGIPLCTKAGKALGVSDHGSIVWDEIVAMFLVLEFTPFTFSGWVMAFVLFRIFDIWKPFPIRQFDAKLKGGFGVMFDDLLAAIYTIATMKLLLCLMTTYAH